MKLLIGLMSVMFSVGAFADAGESRHFNISDSTTYIDTILRGEKTHTEYENRQVRTTCTRQEVEYRTVCTSAPRHPYPGPHYPGHGYPGPGPRYPHGGGTVCQTVPHYRTVIYPCTKTETVSYEVKDYDVEARVSINVTNASAFKDVRGTLSAHLSGDNLYLKASGSKNYFVMLKNRNTKSRITNGVKFLDVNFEVELVKAAPALSNLSLSNLKVEENGNALGFNVGTNDLNDFAIELKIVRNKLIGSDNVVIDRELANHEVEITGSNNRARIDFSRINVELRGGKFDITAAIAYKGKGVLLNDLDFPNLKASRSLTFKAR